MREMGFATFEPQSMSQQQIDQLLQDLYDAQSDESLRWKKAQVLLGLFC